MKFWSPTRWLLLGSVTAISLWACGAVTQPVTVTHAASSTATPVHHALNGVFNVTWGYITCPPGTATTTACYTNMGVGDVSGLGHTTEVYTLLVEDSNPSCPDWRTTAQWTVAVKGTIDFALKSPGCVSLQSPSGPMNYTVTGGSGSYAGASGSGILDSQGQESSPGHGTGTDTWVGSLSVLSPAGQ